MRKISIAIVCFVILDTTALYAQKIKFESDRLRPVGVSMVFERVKGKQAVRVVKDTAVKEFDEPTFVRISEINFTNGIIEVKVLSRLLKSAPEFARGFIGIAFRINDSNTRFESIYLRPTNARADDQVRRNHSIQYFAFPDYKFQRLRKEEPERYETYADLALDEWITMRIIVKKQQAKLYLNNNKQPSLVVNDLKLGASTSGTIGLWVDVGTEGFFSDLIISHE
jgi:hypothetical protein